MITTCLTASTTKIVSGYSRVERTLLSAAMVSDKVMGLLMNAILLVDKPAGISSAEVVRRIKSRVKPARVGHLGTLDPFATGLLPIMIGEATKLAPFIDSGDKEYAGLIRLGVETDTLDRDGAEVRRADVPGYLRREARAGHGAVHRPDRSSPAGIFRNQARRRAAVSARAPGRRGCAARQAQRRDQAPRSHLRSSLTRSDSSRPARRAPMRARWHATSASRSGQSRISTNSAAPATAHSRSPTRCRWPTSSHRSIPARRRCA